MEVSFFQTRQNLQSERVGVWNDRRQCQRMHGRRGYEASCGWCLCSVSGESCVCNAPSVGVFLDNGKTAGRERAQPALFPPVQRRETRRRGHLRWLAPRGQGRGLFPCSSLAGGEEGAKGPGEGGDTGACWTPRNWRVQGHLAHLQEPPPHGSDHRQPRGGDGDAAAAARISQPIRRGDEQDSPEENNRRTRPQGPRWCQRVFSSLGACASSATCECLFFLLACTAHDLHSLLHAAPSACRGLGRRQPLFARLGGSLFLRGVPPHCAGRPTPFRGQRG